MTPEEQPFIRFRNLTKKFGEVEVLRGVSLDIAKSEVVAIIGASGSGKSTLMRCLNLLETPTSGEMFFDGAKIDYEHGGKRALRALRAEIGMVFQSYNLWPHMTVLENVTRAPKIVKGVEAGEARDVAESLLERIGLSDKRQAYPSQLSGGQQQRVAIARALAMRPKVMLFDEVTSALDPELVGEVLDLMAELAREGMTMMVVTHEVAFARDVSTRTVFIHEGMIGEEGPSSEVLSNPKTERLRQFLARVLHAGPVSAGASA